MRSSAGMKTVNNNKSFRKYYELKKILVYSHDTFGLGNIRRMTAIAEDLVNRNPHWTILILSGSPMLQSFRLSPRIDYVKLPCLKRDTSGHYGVKSLGLSMDKTIQLRANIINCTVQEYQPDLVLTDKKPFGIQKELEPAFRWLKFRNAPTKLVLLLRDILDDPSITIPIWEKNQYHEIIRDLYDSILVVGEQGIYDLGKEYQFPKSSLEKLHYCGYLNKSPKGSMKPKQETELPNVMVTPGGGEDGTILLKYFLKGFKSYHVHARFNCYLLLGPELPDKTAKQAREIAEDFPNIYVKDFSNDPIQLIQKADLIVSMAGYNTVCECLSLNKRAVVVPRTTPSKEQYLRAQLMQDAKLLKFIEPTQLTSSYLMETILDELNTQNKYPKRQKTLTLSGLEKVSLHINELLAFADDAPLSEVGIKVADYSIAARSH